MAIKAYIGRMGSGKTYEVVTVVIVGALGAGRRVVTNIAGIQFEVIADYLVSQGKKREELGQLVAVEHEAVLSPTFWRTDKDSEEGTITVIQPGDLVALDEIWRFWDGFGAKAMPDRVLNFFRMHRHLTHPTTGLACDLALITQDVGDISRRVRSVIEETYRMQKLTALGLQKRYRIDLFSGSRIVSKPLLQMQRAYDKRLFAFYQSHSQKKEGDADAKEVNIDGRGNIFKGVLIKFVLPLALLLGLAGVWSVWGFFHPSEGKPVPISGNVSQAKPGMPVGASVVQRPSIEKGPYSEKWRVLGYWEGGLKSRGYLVADGRNVRGIYGAEGVRYEPMALTVMMPEGEVATSFGAAVVAQNAPKVEANLPGQKPVQPSGVPVVRSSQPGRGM